MANIVISNLCQLNCPYCFATNLKESDDKYIEKDALHRIVNFLQRSEEHKVGLIGGEPLLHPAFDEIVNYLVNKEFIHNLQLFTNGIILYRHIEALKSKKVNVLVNYNGPQILTSTQWNDFILSIKLCIENSINIDFGITIYDDECEIDFVIRLMKSLHIDRLRLSIAVPNSKICEDKLYYYWKYKTKILEIIENSLLNDIIPYFDCNCMPLCLISNQERYNIKELFNGRKVTNIMMVKAKCEPVIDIMTNETAVRCFGCGEEVVKINDFNDIDSIRKYFKDNLDNITHGEISDNCNQCLHFGKNCMGGCLSMRI